MFTAKNWSHRHYTKNWLGKHRNKSGHLATCCWPFRRRTTFFGIGTKNQVLRTWDKARKLNSGSDFKIVELEAKAYTSPNQQPRETTANKNIIITQNETDISWALNQRIEEDVQTLTKDISLKYQYRNFCKSFAAERSELSKTDIKPKEVSREHDKPTGDEEAFFRSRRKGYSCLRHFRSLINFAVEVKLTIVPTCISECSQPSIAQIWRKSGI